VLVAALAVPLATSMQIVRAGVADGEDTGALHPGRVDRLSAYLRAHQGDAHYEVAGARIFDTAALIVKDARPVLTLMSAGDQPLLTPSELARESRTGAARYFVMTGTPSCMRQDIATCPPVLRWARAHSIDVSREAGLCRGLLYRLFSLGPGVARVIPIPAYLGSACVRRSACRPRAD
jgi:hypothetical protein